LAVVAIAGVFLAVRANFDPSQGPARLIFGFEAVIIGGVGRPWGAGPGGLILRGGQAGGGPLCPPRAHPRRGVATPFCTSSRARRGRRACCPRCACEGRA